jgi:hypothetical protein
MLTRVACFSLAASLSWAGTSQADSCREPRRILWSYPNAATTVVPTDAVFWAFGYADRLLAIELDGEAIPSVAAAFALDVPWLPPQERSNPRMLAFQQRYEYPLETSRFVPPEPLTPGEHEVVIRSLDWGAAPGTYETTETHRYTIRAEELPPASADAAITAVTAYAWDGEFGPRATGKFPPPEAREGVCDAALVNIKIAYCSYDSSQGRQRTELIENLPATRLEVQPGTDVTARVDIAAQGDALGYVLNYSFIPAGCTALFTSGTNVAAEGEPAALSFYIEPLLPTGLGPARSFTGDVELVEGKGTPEPPIDFHDPPGWWCSLSTVGRRTPDRAGAACALLVALAALGRRTLTSSACRASPPPRSG